MSGGSETGGNTPDLKPLDDVQATIHRLDRAAQRGRPTATQARLRSLLAQQSARIDHSRVLLTATEDR